MKLQRMNIRDIDGLSTSALREAIESGSRVVRFDYTISLLITTLQRKSGAHLVRPGQKASSKGISYTILSSLFGWWGIPDGPKQTLKSIRTNLRGGRDVTEDVKSILDGSSLFKTIEKEKSAG